jgi:hypothetical protein
LVSHCSHRSRVAKLAPTNAAHGVGSPWPMALLAWHHTTQPVPLNQSVSLPIARVPGVRNRQDHAAARTDIHWHRKRADGFQRNPAPKRVLVTFPENPSRNSRSCGCLRPDCRAHSNAASGHQFSNPRRSGAPLQKRLTFQKGSPTRSPAGTSTPTACTCTQLSAARDRHWF